MNRRALPHPPTWENFWPLMVGGLLGISLFLFLLFTVGQVAALLMALGVIALCGMLQYLWWGRRMTQSVARQRAAEQIRAHPEEN